MESAEVPIQEIQPIRKPLAEVTFNLQSLQHIPTEEVRSGIIQILSEEWGSEGISLVVDSVEQGGHAWSATQVLSELAGPQHVKDIARFLALPVITHRTDRSSLHSLVKLGERLSWEVPQEDIAEITASLQASVTGLINLKEDLENEDKVLLAETDIFNVSRLLLSLDKTQRVFIEEMLQTRQPFSDEFREDIRELFGLMQSGFEIDFDNNTWLSRKHILTLFSNDAELDADAFEQDFMADDPVEHILESLVAVNDFQIALETLEKLNAANPEDIAKWKSQVRRLIRRSVIEQQLEVTSSLEQTKNAVRQFESEFGVDEVIHSLVEQDVIVQEKMAELAEEVSTYLRDKFPKAKGIVLLGSSVHGGAEIRRITESPVNPDFDWGIISDEVLDSIEKEEMVDYVEAHLPELATKFNFDSHFHSCSFVNPSHYSFKTIDDSEDAENRLRNAYFDKSVILSLQPSFPAEINEKNKEFIFNALSSLAVNHEDEWAEAVENILHRWSDIHLLKSKHFNIPANFKDQKIASKVVGSSAKVMGEPMKQQLRATHWSSLEADTIET